MVATDEERGCVELSQQGDPEAFELLVKKYQRMIHALTFRMTGSMADAQDLAQETFIQAFQQIRQFRGEASFSSWLYRIAVNKCMTWHKRERRKERLHEDWNVCRDEASQAHESLAQRVQAALLKLNPKQRAAVVLTIYDGLSHADAARALGCAEATVSWRAFAAKRKLKRLLGNLQS
jgi:RNA polymerase sigma-70 factor (ECF subfamily)